MFNLTHDPHDPHSHPHSHPSTHGHTHARPHMPGTLTEMHDVVAFFVRGFVWVIGTD